MKMQELVKLIEQGDEYLFYVSTEWRSLRERILHMDNHECQLCKQHGRYRRGVLVHHVKHLRDRPDLALSIYDPETGERQLITVCKQCHEEQHPEALRPNILNKREQITSERWD